MTLVSNNYLRMETGGSESTINDLAFLNAEATYFTTAGRIPATTWQFQSMVNAQPLLGAYTVGDYARVVFQGNPVIPDGQTRLRITSVAVNLGEVWATISATADRS
jgi:hypothetical protein